jgi:hypothetical protein
MTRVGIRTRSTQAAARPLRCWGVRGHYSDALLDTDLQHADGTLVADLRRAVERRLPAHGVEEVLQVRLVVGIAQHDRHRLLVGRLPGASAERGRICRSQAWAVRAF